MQRSLLTQRCKASGCQQSSRRGTSGPRSTSGTATPAQSRCRCRICSNREPTAHQCVQHAPESRGRAHRPRAQGLLVGFTAPAGHQWPSGLRKQEGVKLCAYQGQAERTKGPSRGCWSGRRRCHSDQQRTAARQRSPTMRGTRSLHKTQNKRVKPIQKHRLE